VLIVMFVPVPANPLPPPPKMPNVPGFEDLRPLEAETRREAVARVELIVDLRVERFGRFLAHVWLLPVGLAEWSAVDVRQRHVLENRARNRADAVGGDDVARERLPPAPVGIAGAGVEDRRRRGAQVAVAERRRRHRRPLDAAAVVQRVLVIAEVEQPVDD
jgi:hypothetical protein